MAIRLAQTVRRVRELCPSTNTYVVGSRVLLGTENPTLALGGWWDFFYRRLTVLGQTAVVPFWGQTTQTVSKLSPKQDCSPQRVI